MENFQRINNYVHVYDFPHYVYLLKNKNYLDKIFIEQITKGDPNTYNVPIFEGEIYEFLNNYFLELIQKYYVVSPLFQRSSIGIYKQDNKNYKHCYHNHIISGSINIVVYINPPPSSDGGGISFLLHNDPIDIPVQPEKVYVFPSWLLHTPLPQTSPSPRYSINWSYDSYIRPVHKITGDRW